jgi:hypothetical protein
VSVVDLLLQWAGFALIVLGSFLRYDRWPGHDLVGKVHEVLGWLALLVEAALRIESNNAANLNCFRLPPIERAECLITTPKSQFWNNIETIGWEIVENVVIGLVARGLGWLLAKLIPGHGRCRPDKP